MEQCRDPSRTTHHCARPARTIAIFFGLHLGNILSQSMGDAAASNVTTQFHTIDGHDLCRVHVRACGFPVDATVIVDRKGQME
jgi:hypothetical protein